MRYRTIVTDPPWDYEGFATAPQGERNRGLKPKTADLPYGAMSVEEICALPVGDWAEPDCRLFMWTTNRYLPDSFRVLDAWGFKYRQTLVWHKTGNPSPFGGSVAPIHAEFLLVAHKGTPAVVNSLLYGAATRAGFALGYRRLITYTQADESGASLRAAGWKVIAQRPPRKGWTTPSRPREDRGADHMPRTLWEAAAWAP